LAGYEIYQPLLREQRRGHGRKITVTPLSASRRNGEKWLN
jgi:hypothetical protein